MIAFNVFPTVFVGDKASERGVARSLSVSTVMSVAATSLVGVVIISAIGAITVHVLLYFLQDLYHLELNCIVGERVCGKFIWRSFTLLLFLCACVLLLHS